MYSSSLASATLVKRTRAVPEVRKVATELSLDSEKNSPDGGAITSLSERNHTGVKATLSEPS